MVDHVIKKPEEKFTVYFETLGCKVNQCESEAMAAMFQKSGYQVIEDAENADICIVNTCTVTHVSDRKSRQVIRRLACANKFKKPIVVVTGCYAQTAKEEIQTFPEVDIVLGTNQKNNIVQAVESFLLDRNKKSYVTQWKEQMEFEELDMDRIIHMSRAYLKIQEGCQQFCSYCIIPYARGPLRSRNMASIQKEAEKLEKAGFHEIILTGIHLGAYGKEKNSEGYDLADVCALLLEKTSIPRIRLGSIEPTEVTDKLLKLMAENPRICRQLHIPLQNGEDEILQRMNRPYRTADYRAMIKKVREKIADIAITTDVMVGFPGETDDHFRQCLMFCDEMQFSGMHIFKYSPREHTPASSYLNQVPAAVKDKRSKQLATVAEKHALSYMEKFLGKEFVILIEHEVKKDQWEGHTDNYLKIIVNGQYKKGELISVIIQSQEKGKLFGEIIEKTENGLAFPIENE